MTVWNWPNSKIDRVIDGDSLTAFVTKAADLGFFVTNVTTFPVRLRLNRINAPPVKTPEGRLSKVFLEQLVMPVVLPWSLMIETLKGYKYGSGDIPEWMCEITLPDGRNVSDLMVSEGHAQYWNGVGPRPGG